MENVYRVSPSDLTFLYERCKRCFVLKVKYDIKQPSRPLPTVFNTIANLQKESYAGKRTTEFCASLKSGYIALEEKKVCSKLIPFVNLAISLQIFGKFDALIIFDDGTCGIIDFKTGTQKDYGDLYKRQLHAYAYAIERPSDESSIGPAKVSVMGLLYFEPSQCEIESSGFQRISGPVKWVEIIRDDEWFIQEFLHEVASYLRNVQLPPPDPNCEWCNYIRRIEERGWIPKEGTTHLKVPYCPKCGALMVLKEGKRGKFWSCSRFPECRGSCDY